MSGFNSLKVHLILLFLIINSISAQVYFPADPSDLLFTEQKIMMGGDDPGSLMIRPVISPFKQENSNWSLKIRNEVFYNSGAPNLENTSDRWIGKGVSFFTSANFAYKSDYFFASFEPFYFISQNDDYNEPLRIPKFSHLNDNRAHEKSPYSTTGVRETQLYLHYKGIGGGYSNANMWWGPGLHTSLMMTNNTTGFGHLMLGTINEQRYKNWGFNGRYVFSKFGKNSISKPFYSGFIVNATYYSKPIVTLGFSRAFLSGGKYATYDITSLEAALLPFQFVTIEKTTSQSDLLNPVDQTYTGYINFRFPESGLVMYLEWGRNEGPESMRDFLSHPDHSRAFIFGLRKHGLFRNINLMFGVEYANLLQTTFWKLRETIDWNSSSQFDFNTYNGRYWAAHSGPDSDDFTIYLVYNNKKLSIMPSINLERHNVAHPNALLYQKGRTLVYDNFHGIHYIGEDRVVLYDMSHLAEGKLEFKADLRYLYKGFRFLLYYEHEILFNQNFDHSGPYGIVENDLKEGVQTKSSNIFWIGVEKYFDGRIKGNIKDLFGKLKN